MESNIFTFQEILDFTETGEQEFLEWQKAGLIEPVGHSEEHAAFFSGKTVERIKHIKQFTQMGYSIEEVRKILRKVGIPSAKKSGKTDGPEREQLLRYYLDENSFSDKFIFNHLQLTDRSGRHPLFSDIGSLGDHLLNLAGKCMREMEWFKSLLFIDRLKALREGRLRQIAHRIAAAVMRKDRVFSPEAVRTTLTGDKGDIPIRVSEHAPSLDYSHKSPFPDSAWESSEAYCVFDEIMESAGSMYCNV